MLITEITSEWVRGWGELMATLLSIQFFYKPKMSLKNKLLIKQPNKEDKCKK